jgi:hypothetical protein
VGDEENCAAADATDADAELLAAASSVKANGRRVCWR